MESQKLQIRLQELYKEINNILPLKLDYDIFHLHSDKSGASIYRRDEYYLLTKNNTFSTIKNIYNPNIFIDVGANIGFMSVFFNKIFNLEKTIIIEPNNKLIPIIEKNCIENQIKNYIILDKIVGDTEGIEHEFQINEMLSVDSRVSSLKESFHTIKAYETTIDEIIKNQKISYNSSVIIKIDTQGFEERVFNGMIKTLKNFNDFIVIMEFAPYWLELQNTDSNKFINTILENFNVFEMPNDTTFNKLDFFKLKITSTNSSQFVDHIKRLKNNGQGWTDIIITKKN